MTAPKPDPYKHFKWLRRDCPCNRRCCPAPQTFTKGCQVHLPVCDELCDDNWVTVCVNCESQCGCDV